MVHRLHSAACGADPVGILERDADEADAPRLKVGGAISSRDRDLPALGNEPVDDPSPKESGSPGDKDRSAARVACSRGAHFMRPRGP